MLNEQHENTFSAEVKNSFEMISRFLDNFPPAEVKKVSWDLLAYALGSEDANGLTHFERSNMLFFYEQINKLCEALVVIDESGLAID